MNLIDYGYICGEILNKEARMLREGLVSSEQDFMVSYLRTQIETLNKLLAHVQENNALEDYIPTTLKRVEKDIRWLRKFHANT